MVWNVLASAADKTREFNNIGEAALYALLGFLMVFAGIAFLIFVVWLVGKIMSKTTGKTKRKTKGKQAAETQATAKKEDKTALVQETDTEEITEETVAVITAAIMAYYQQNNPKCEFTVKRIKRI